MQIYPLRVRTEKPQKLATVSDTELLLKPASENDLQTIYKESLRKLHHKSKNNAVPSLYHNCQRCVCFWEKEWHMSMLTVKIAARTLTKIIPDLCSYFPISYKQPFVIKK